MKQRILWGLVASVWGALVFVVGLHLFFPSDALQARAEWQVAESSGGEYQLSVVKAGLWRLSGIALKQATLYKAVDPRKSRRGAKAEKDVEIEVRPVLGVEKLALRLQLLPLLTGKQVLSLKSSLYGGRADGKLSRSEAMNGLILDVDGVRLELLPLAGDNWSLDLSGLAQLSADLNLATEDLDTSTGSGELILTDLEMVSGSVFGFDLPEGEKFEKAKIRFQIKDGKIEITEGVLMGDLVELEISGSITLSSRGFYRSRPRLEVEFRPGEALDALLQFTPGVKDARQDNGSYKYSVTGTVEKPRFRADKPRSSRTKRSRRSSTDDDEGFSAEDDEADERRDARRERMKERRERMRERRDDDRQRAASDDDEVDVGEVFEDDEDLNDLPTELELEDEPIFEDGGASDYDDDVPQLRDIGYIDD